MHFPTREELENEGFEPLFQIDEKLAPAYFAKSTKKFSILAKHVINNEYIFHGAQDINGQNYDEVDLNNDDRFEPIDTIKSLEKELLKVRTVKPQASKRPDDPDDESYYTFLMPEGF